ncbi:MAG: type IV pilus modification PilV family protein [Elusimicrobiota bacterium]
MNFKRKYNRGITYIEIMLAVAIISIISTAFAQLFIKNNIALNETNLRTLASSWAADKMEEVKSYYYTDLSTGTWSSETEVLGKNKKFTRSVKVIEIENGLKEIEVEVTWETSEGSSSSRLVTYMAAYE